MYSRNQTSRSLPLAQARYSTDGSGRCLLRDAWDRVAAGRRIPADPGGGGGELPLCLSLLYARPSHLRKRSSSRTKFLNQRAGGAYTSYYTYRLLYIPVKSVNYARGDILLVPVPRTSQSEWGRVRRCVAVLLVTFSCDALAAVASRIADRHHLFCPRRGRTEGASPREKVGRRKAGQLFGNCQRRQ